METDKKPGRTPSRCREWERNRRNKFNDAITRLGDIIKKIAKCNGTVPKEGEDIQYPKVEIVEKAILCLTEYIQEKTQLKAEILALQVKIDSIQNGHPDKKDASTQVFIGINRKKQNGKVKMLMLKKSKHNAIKDKAILTPIVTDPTTTESTKSSNKVSKKSSLHQKLPILLPRSNPIDKKRSENTIVVLPGAPYIFPQRPLMFPTVPPTYVLVDSNLQPINKPSFPGLNRNNGDITRTTMVNILPISAYSRPLSATKVKKNSKTKSEAAKKALNKKVKALTKIVKESASNTSKEDKIVDKTRDKDTEKEAENIEEDSQTNKNMITKNFTGKIKIANKSISAHNSNAEPKLSKSCDISNNKSNEVPNTSIVQDVPKCSKSIDVIDNPACVPIVMPKSSENIIKAKAPDKQNKHTEKLPEDKENKLPSILDTTLCENTVDGGNARLELAEEFLAASPTAAFLMSFPLVSGNRADSPAEEPHHSIQINTKENNQRQNEIPSHAIPYFEKPVINDLKEKSSAKTQTTSTNLLNKPQNDHHKCVMSNVKTLQSSLTSNVSIDNPFINLPMSSLIPTSCTISDPSFSLDFDCNINKSMASQPANYVSNNNLFYKSDPFSSVKSTIYSTSSISSGHEFNSFGLYPCAMEKYTSKNKCDYPNVEENLMKIGSSRLTYDIDLSWPHKGFDFVNCTTTSTTTNIYNKDSIITTAAAPYSSSYNPFNPEFHVPLVTSSVKKDSSTKPSASLSETFNNFYSQPNSLWSEEVPFYTNNNVPKALTTKQQNYLPLDTAQPTSKPNLKQYDNKHISMDNVNVTKSSSSHTGGVQLISDRYIKKSQNKMHINWMTSEIRPMQSNCNPMHIDVKDIHKTVYGHIDPLHNKKQEHTESNYFPLLNFPSQSVQEELQTWPSSRGAGTTEITIEPPPINLPTLVGDLALGPHDKKKTTDIVNRVASHSDIQNCSNFFSVTHLMNRSTNNNVGTRDVSRYPEQSAVPKSNQLKHNIAHVTNDSTRKITPRADNLTQPCYLLNDMKPGYENVNQFSHNQTKTKSTKADKNSKAQKNNYSAEALIRGGTCTQKVPDNNSNKFMMSSQKYDFNTQQDSSVAQVSHFPAILDYSDNAYTGQQFSGTNLYNSTTNTISNSFYSNFIPGSSNLMSGNYTSAPFSGDFIDYNQSTECNYSNHKYEDLKIRNNTPIFQQEKAPTNFKTSRRESAAKHKLECSKKDISKKYQSKRTKLNTEVEEWNDSSHLLWQNKTPTKRHSNLITEELPFPNYVGNQVPAQYQPEFFNSHIMPSNMHGVGPNVDRSLATVPLPSRANFNLSSIFPEITMKVQ